MNDRWIVWIRSKILRGYSNRSLVTILRFPSIRVFHGRYDLVTYREDRKLFMDEYTKSKSKVASIRNLTLFHASNFCKPY